VSVTVSATFKLRGADSFVRLASLASTRAQAAVQGVITTHALRIERLLKKELSTAGSGKTRGNHTSSAPGESPASDTGRYRNSIRHELRRLAARVVTDVRYATVLEFGGEDIEPRPMWRPVIQKVANVFRRDIIHALDRVL